VIAVAPVTDFTMLKEDYVGFTSAELVARDIGSGPNLIEGSPLRRAAEIQVPVLLAHGDLDANVAFRHSEKMAGALRSAGKQVDFLAYKGLDHDLVDSTVRTELLTRMGQLLESTIGR